MNGAPATFFLSDLLAGLEHAAGDAISRVACRVRLQIVRLLVDDYRAAGCVVHRQVRHGHGEQAAAAGADLHVPEVAAVADWRVRAAVVRARVRVEVRTGALRRRVDAGALLVDVHAVLAVGGVLDLDQHYDAESSFRYARDARHVSPVARVEAF